MASGAAQRGLRLFVGNIPWTISRKELVEYFSQYGPVRHGTVKFDLKTGLSRGFGFIEMATRRAREDVLAQGNHQLEGAKLYVEPEYSAERNNLKPLHQENEGSEV